VPSRRHVLPVLQASPCDDSWRPNLFWQTWQWPQFFLEFLQVTSGCRKSTANFESIHKGYQTCPLLMISMCVPNNLLLRTTKNFNTQCTWTPLQHKCPTLKNVQLSDNPQSFHQTHSNTFIMLTWKFLLAYAFRDDWRDLG